MTYKDALEYFSKEKYEDSTEVFLLVFGGVLYIRSKQQLCIVEHLCELVFTCMVTNIMNTMDIKKLCIAVFV